jgi:hypothetical protein
LDEFILQSRFLSIAIHRGKSHLQARFLSIGGV